MPTVHSIDEPNTNQATHRGWTRRPTHLNRPARKRLNTVFQGIIMNTKHIIAALSLALVGSAAMAVEATQDDVAPSRLTRAAAARTEPPRTQAPPAIIVRTKKAPKFADGPTRHPD